MAARWSSENVVVEFRDSQATAMSVDCLGRHAVLSGRRFLNIVNLDAPLEVPRKIARQSKWDIGTVQWNPHESCAFYFAASCNSRAIVISLFRDTRKPTVALSAVAGASQVKWNRKNQHCLASSHDGDVRIWDKRKPNTAVEYVAAHLSKIHGLDWHPDNEFILATSSQDNSVRFWDYRQPRKYLNILSCQVPVWKARYTPFSNGLVTVMVPQLRRENSLLLWSVFDLNAPVHTFVGHDDVVLEFQWRRQKEGSKDYQLVTWSRDQTLRIWRVDPQLQRLCANSILEGVDELMDGMSLESDKTLLSQDSEPQQTPGHGTEEEEAQRDDLQSSMTPTGKLDQLGLPQTLQQEFSLVNLQIRNVNVEMDAMNRSCAVSAHCGSNRVCMVVMFPAQYPNNAAPSFQFVSPTTIPSSMKAKILKILKDTSLQKVKRNQNCLEPCVRQLVSCLESCVKSRRWKGKREGTDSINRPIKAAGKVIIQDISWLLPVHKQLGETYVLHANDIQDTCQRNAAAALAVGRRDLAKVWALASAATGSDLSPHSDPDESTPWARHPFGRHLLETLLTHFSQIHDIQTLAMLCSVFEGQSSPQDYLSLYGQFPHRTSIFTPPNRFPSYTSSGSCSSTSDSGLNTSGWNIVGRDPEHTLPWGESSPDDYRFGNQAHADPREREKEQHDKNKRLLDPVNSLQFDDFKKCYGEILYRWGLREKRAEVLKFASCPPDPHRGIEFGVYCCHCRSEVRGTQCAVCKQLTFQCAICHVAVRGSSNFCLNCGHGGHTSHMMEWFRTQEVCPTGCGCHCHLQSTF
ncbi:UNVERIFIED_CONTAM: hypothetical protein FKN15_055498 [Acipenser sinensis]